MEDLYQKLNEILKFFTTDALTGLPQQIGKFTCIPLMSPGMEHAGYLIVKGAEMHFFPAAAMKNIASEYENTPGEIENFIEEQWQNKTAMCLN